MIFFLNPQDVKTHQNMSSFSLKKFKLGWDLNVITRCTLWNTICCENVIRQLFFFLFFFFFFFGFVSETWNKMTDGLTSVKQTVCTRRCPHKHTKYRKKNGKYSINHKVWQQITRSARSLSNGAPPPPPPQKGGGGATSKFLFETIEQPDKH